ncbi:hypothetical protein PI124_g10448 [Phytophthora idaei]|nr:hypothetical protein PI125_g7117 [Phytophthora idaei]KAG3128834.1 hypothetical protein PI126_g21216 [Phytophthora idaei]KAG3244791.1 hypothetical protein PI124_g10448 [Phytophthora idaei]
MDACHRTDYSCSYREWIHRKRLPSLIAVVGSTALHDPIGHFPQPQVSMLSVQIKLLV